MDRSGAPSIARAVAQFALTGLVALVVFLVGSLFVFQNLGRKEALRDARQFASLTGQGIVEPALTDGVLSSEQDALQRLDRLVQERVLGERVVRVKIWDVEGRILYSDEPRLIGDRYPLDESKLDVLRTGAARAELSDLEGAENRFERGFEDLYEVYLPIRVPDGTPLLYETYQRGSSVTSIGRRIWVPFAALLLGSLVLLWLVQVPLAWRLARRLQRTQEDREALLVEALEASADERRRIAADLHDGVVQDLAGISYSLSAVAERTDERTPVEVREAVAEAADATRDTMRRLRSALVDINPANLRAAGLEAALADIVAPLAADGVEATVAVTGEPLPEDVERLFYRGATEAIRNVREHAGASRATIRVSSSGGLARLEVVDDGQGFSEDELERRRADGHVGLSLLEGLASRMGGSLKVVSTPGQGTSFALEVPTP
ncbi:MAG TPA: ATP-binding protein [Gaiellaceae bacterium]|nr:ATP-binding protein [Gaiellaceae bacterium]